MVSFRNLLFSRDSVLNEPHVDDANVIMLCYNVKTRSSFEKLRVLYDEACRSRKSDQFPRVLVATKCDDEKNRQVSVSEGEKLAEEWDFSFFEASAKTGMNVDYAFHKAFQEYWSAEQNKARQSKTQPKQMQKANAQSCKTSLTDNYFFCHLQNR